MPLPSNLWRDSLQQASFRGAPFWTEVYSVGGGRRNVEHEFPLRDTPFAEDMGRRAERYTVTAYVIGEDYQFQRDALWAACEADGVGTLVLPTYLTSFQVICDNFNVSEPKEKGGMAMFEMSFSEAGSLDGSGISINTLAGVMSAAANLGATSVQSMTNLLSGSGVSGPLAPTIAGLINA